DCSSSALASASAASWGQPSSNQSSAERHQSPASSSAYGSAAIAGTCSSTPARRFQAASSPLHQADPRSIASERALSVASTTAAASPSSHAASALAAATGARRGSPPVGSASAQDSSSRAR